MPLYSHSRISCFEKCPHKYKLKYIDKVIPEVEQTIEAFMGSMVHRTLEKLYRDLRFSKTDSLEELLAHFNALWAKELSPTVLVVRKEYTPENYRLMGEGYLKAYYGSHRPFDSARTVGLEQQIKIDLNDDGRYLLQGFIDRLACAPDGTYEVHDYKTNSNLPLRQYLEEDRQLALYALAVMRSYPNVSQVRLVWHFLSFDQDIVIHKAPEELEKLRVDTLAAVKAIEEAKAFPTKSSQLCGWCEFRALCPEWAHVAKTESMTLERFLKEPGVSLVNRYAELSGKKGAVEAEMEIVKAKLLEFARENGVNVVAGSGCSAKVWRAEKLRFPGRDEEGRAELEDFLRKAGLWNDVAALDTFQLSKIMDRPPWPKEIAKAVERFGKLETLEKIYLRKSGGRAEE